MLMDDGFYNNLFMLEWKRHILKSFSSLSWYGPQTHQRGTNPISSLRMYEQALRIYDIALRMHDKT